MEAPFLETHEGIVVLRDDLFPGGTKARVLPALLDAPGIREYVYASPVYGYMQVALAHTARLLGKRATIFCAQRRLLHPRTLEAQGAGAHIVQVPYGYLSVVQARALAYCAVTGATLLPFGGDSPVMHLALVALARALPLAPPEVWCVAGSGTLCRALQAAWPEASVHAVRIGAAPRVGRAVLHVAPEPFEKGARVPPPFRSCPNYDAKAWRFVQRYASPGALFWNVAG